MTRIMAGLLLTAAWAGMASAQTNPAPAWTIEKDIPRPGPADVGFAGAERPNIARYLMVRGASAPAVSPDGKTLAYLSNVTGEPQVWTVPAAGGWPEQRTFGSTVTALGWTPAGRYLLYAADTAGDEREGYFLLSPDGRSERALLPKAGAFRRFGGFSRDGRRFVYSSTERNGRDFDIYLGETATGRTRLVHQGRFGVYAAGWQPDGNLVVLAETRGEDGADLSLLNVKTGEVRSILKPAVPSANESIAWRRDGRGFYVVTNQDRDFRAVAYYDVASAQLSIVEEAPHELGSVRLSDDGRWLAWLSNEDGYSWLHVRDLVNKRLVDPPTLPRGAYQIEFAERAPVLQVSVSAGNAVGEVVLWNPAEGTTRTPVRTNWAGLDPATMVAPEVVRFSGRDGTRLSGLFYAPKPAGAKPPLVLLLHGGPSAQAVPDWDPLIQYLVARGMAVYDFNYRGSTGFGKAFAGLNDRRLRPNELGDLTDAVAHLRKAGRVNATRAAVMGGSYGGYLTNAVVGAEPGLFVAGVSMVGVTDWVTALEGASPSLKASDRVEYGDIDNPDDRKFFASISPINNVAKVRTPLVVMHGANDPRDPVTESDALVKGVRANGVEVVYLRFPDEGHGISKLANRVHGYTVAADFLERRFGLAK